MKQMLEEMKSMLTPGSAVGYTVLVELRSICTTLGHEVAITEFRPCKNLSYGLCGSTKQKEFSTEQIGGGAEFASEIFYDVFKFNDGKYPRSNSLVTWSSLRKKNFSMAKCRSRRTYSSASAAPAMEDIVQDRV